MANEKQASDGANKFPFRMAPLDLNHLKEQVNNDRDVLREIVLLFFEETELQMRRLKEAFAAQDYDTLEKAAHSLKGSFSSLHAHSARLHVQDLETAVVKKQIDGVLRGVESIEADLAELRLHLKPLADPGDS